MTNTEFLASASYPEPDWAAVQNGNLLLTHSQLVAEAQRRFGPDPRDWAFQCPGCDDVATAHDFLEIGEDADLAGRVCIGVYLREIFIKRAENPSLARGCEERASFGGCSGPWTVVVQGVYGEPDGRRIFMFPLAEVEEFPNCECCEDRGCDMCDPLHYETHTLKWIAEGLTTLNEVVVAAERQAHYLRERLEAGWILDYPVDTGYVHLHLPATDDKEVDETLSDGSVV